MKAYIHLGKEIGKSTKKMIKESKHFNVKMALNVSLGESTKENKKNNNEIFFFYLSKYGSFFWYKYI